MKNRKRSYLIAVVLCLWFGPALTTSAATHESEGQRNQATRGARAKRIFGIQSLDDMDRPEIRRRVRELSPITHLTDDDPPVYMEYRMSPFDPVPDRSKAHGWALHHVIFGLTLEVRMKALGLEAELRHPNKDARYDSISDFFTHKFAKEQKETEGMRSSQNAFD